MSIVAHKFLPVLWHGASATLRKKSTPVCGGTQLILIHNYCHVLGNHVRLENAVSNFPECWRYYDQAGEKASKAQHIFSQPCCTKLVLHYGRGRLL